MLFEFIRKLTCNFSEIEKYVPKNGNILDVGCGHGIFSKLLIDRSPKRNILSIDPSPKKIALAKSNYAYVKNLKYENTYIEKVKDRFDVIVVIDVIYLFPPKDKSKFLKVVKKHLKPNGFLVLVINGTDSAWIHKILIIQEKFMHNILKFTYSDFDRTYFESKNETVKLLKDSGFEIKKIAKVKSIIPYPHLLFLASYK
jgi:2-polyprenyl-3-methyl-5-hydroxy-6-metoxy-1,4-benzoquinol methylase